MAINDDLKISKEYLKLLCKMAFSSGVIQQDDFRRFHSPVKYEKSPVCKIVNKMQTSEEQVKELINPQPKEPIITTTFGQGYSWESSNPTTIKPLNINIGARKHGKTYWDSIPED